MMTNSLKIRLILAAVLLAGGMTVHCHPGAISGVVETVQSWIGAKSTVVQAVIVEESSERSKLPQTQIIAITKASSIGIKVIDKDSAVPPDLQKFLDAAKGKPLPQLVVKRSNGRVTSAALPPTFGQLRDLK